MANSKYGRILAIAITACVILLGILFIVCCAHLYFTGGNQPYSRERVGEYLIILAIPSVIGVGLIVSGIVYSAMNGEKNDIYTTKRTSSELLESFSKRYGASSFEGEAAQMIIKERNNRNAIKYFSLFFSAAIFLIVIAYTVFFASFTIDNLNADVVAALTVALPLSVIAVGVHIPVAYYTESSAQRELDIMKNYIKENGAPRAVKNEKHSADYSVIVKCAVLAVAVVFIALGIVNGGMGDVFAKAVKICTECIGLG